jgi:hypothetical protein
MNPAKEKAKELVEKFKPMCHNVKHTGILDGLATVMNDDIINLYAAKQCALIAVNEKLEELSEVPSYGIQYLLRINFLEEVKQEIEKL